MWLHMYLCVCVCLYYVCMYICVNTSPENKSWYISASLINFFWFLFLRFFSFFFLLDIQFALSHGTQPTARRGRVVDVLRLLQKDTVRERHPTGFAALSQVDANRVVFDSTTNNNASAESQMSVEFGKKRTNRRGSIEYLNCSLYICTYIQVYIEFFSTLDILFQKERKLHAAIPNSTRSPRDVPGTFLGQLRCLGSSALWLK